jgi:hypothetical protein
MAYRIKPFWRRALLAYYSYKDLEKAHQAACEQTKQYCDYYYFCRKIKALLNLYPTFEEWDQAFGEGVTK